MIEVAHWQDHQEECKKNAALSRYYEGRTVRWRIGIMTARKEVETRFQRLDNSRARMRMGIILSIEKLRCYIIKIF